MSKRAAALLLLLIATQGWCINPRELGCIIDASTELAATDTIQQALTHYNQSATNPLLLDRRWPQLDKHSPDVRQLTENPAAAPIWALIRRYALQGEGFLIGLNGGLVAATNLTSDFYQADEALFSEAITLAKGQAWITSDIVDTSASAVLIKIAVPVFDTTASENSDEPSRATGVLVIGLDEFVVDFYRGCHILDHRD